MSDNVKKEIPKLKVKCNLTCQGIYALPKLIFIIGSKCIGCCRWAWWILKCYKVLLGFEHLHYHVLAYVVEVVPLSNKKNDSISKICETAVYAAMQP